MPATTVEGVPQRNLSRPELGQIGSEPESTRAPKTHRSPSAFLRFSSFRNEISSLFAFLQAGESPRCCQLRWGRSPPSLHGDSQRRGFNSGALERSVLNQRCPPRLAATCFCSTSSVLGVRFNYRRGTTGPQSVFRVVRLERTVHARCNRPSRERVTPAYTLLVHARNRQAQVHRFGACACGEIDSCTSSQVLPALSPRLFLVKFFDVKYEAVRAGQDRRHAIVLPGRRGLPVRYSLSEFQRLVVWVRLPNFAGTHIQ